MVKMSETTPATRESCSRAWPAATSTGGEVTVVNGGPDVAQAFCRLPFDHLLFTGSTGVGRQVMHAAAENLTPVTLELGGQVPGDRRPRLSRWSEAAGRVMFGKCLNAGQTCIAPDYALVPEESVERVRRGGEARRDVALPDARGQPRLHGHRRRAPPRRAWRGCSRTPCRKGARAIEINPAGEDVAAAGKRAPTLLTGVDDSMTRDARGDLRSRSCRSFPTATSTTPSPTSTRRPRPLALYIFEHDATPSTASIRRTVSGGVTVNETILHIAQDDLPFGGRGRLAAWATTTVARDSTRFRSARPSSASRGSTASSSSGPPYGRRFESLVRLLLR